MGFELEIRNGLAWVVLNRPDKRNAVDVGLHLGLRSLWPRLQGDDSVRVIILTGAGSKSFCAGADVNSFLPYLRDRIAVGDDPLDFCGLTRRRPSKPIIAALNGAALGGGLELALAADIRIAANHARMGLPEVKLGAIAGAGGITRLSRLIPDAVARDMILTGREITAQRAYELGLVSEVTPLEQLHERAETIAQFIAENSPTAVALSRSVLEQIADLPLEEALDIEREAFRHSTATDDFRIGIESFRAKRKPVFTGK